MTRCTSPPPPAIGPLNGPVQNKAHPGVHQQPDINLEWVMTARQRQVWHQDEEVKQAARHNRNKLLEKSSKHALVGHW